jgi:hypothetical protein
LPRKRQSTKAIHDAQAALRRLHGPVHRLGCGCDAIHCTAMRLGYQAQAAASQAAAEKALAALVARGPKDVSDAELLCALKLAGCDAEITGREDAA